MAEYVSGGTAAQKYVFTEKERDIETGYDYFGARYYDSDLGRWMTVDPLADKYPGWSPYNYVMGNPLNSYDPDGRDVIVLLAPKGANRAGHSAILIGNSKTGWTYISKNGTLEGEKDLYGKSDFTYLVQEEGETFNQFLAEVEDRDRQDYEVGYWMISDTDEDRKMINAALTNAKELYKLLTNNCMDVVTKALESIALHGGHVNMPMNGNGISSGVTYKDYNAIPNIRYEIIKANNVGFELILSNDTVYKRKKAEAGLE
ncbi:MAG: RHS repeat-associated core domain-containing protein [Ignavibacteriales bacterium]|nr:MAG: RHS repeat-associated core domain-containing protein [Ignavibacteriales bacterium]